MSEPAFIEEIEPEAAVRVTVCLRSTDQYLNTVLTASQAAILIASYTTRDMTARETLMVQTINSVLCLDLDQVSAINVEPSRSRQVGSLLKKVEELST